MEIILGAVVAGLVQWLKKYSTNEYMTLGILAVLALVASGIYTYLVSAGYWQTVAGLLVTASLIYTWVIARFEK